MGIYTENKITIWQAVVYGTIVAALVGAILGAERIVSYLANSSF